MSPGTVVSHCGWVRWRILSSAPPSMSPKLGVCVMFTTLKIAAFTGVFLTGLFGPDRTGLAGAPQQARSEHSAHGGILATAYGLRFEVLFYPSGTRVFPLDSSGGAVDTSRLAGSATFYHPN